MSSRGYKKIDGDGETLITSEGFDDFDADSIVEQSVVKAEKESKPSLEPKYFLKAKFLENYTNEFVLEFSGKLLHYVVLSGPHKNMETITFELATDLAVQLSECVKYSYACPLIIESSISYVHHEKKHIVERMKKENKKVNPWTIDGVELTEFKNSVCVVTLKNAR